MSEYSSSDGLTPHGFCLLWQPGLIWLHAISDGLIALAYFSIPLALVVFVAQRKDLVFNWIFVLFAVFIMACGATHVMEIVTLWRPVYWLQGAFKALTALASIGTAILLWPLIPRALAIPSPAALRAANARLQEEIEERAKAEATLRQAQKMESIGQLTGGIAHDFNNLLTIIMGGVERLQRRLPPDSSERRSADIAMQGAERAATLTQRLLAFSRRQPLKPEPLDANALLGDLTELLQRSLGEEIEVVIEVGADLWPVSADRGQLESALLNLAINARDAMPGGGKLIIATANTSLDAAYARRNPEVQPGDYVLVSVADTGIGMAPETLAKAFEPFFTTKELGHGTGLGLSQVYGFVRQSDGHIKIYSEPGHGTSVKIYLPRCMPLQQATATVIPAPARAAVGDGRTILVVEDDAAVRETSVELLQELGYRVVAAESGAAALRILEATPHIDLLFTDVGMPGGMNGRELADQVQRLRPEVKIVFTSGYAQTALVHQGRLDNGVELLVKPYTFEGLAQIVGRVLQTT